MEVPVGSSLTGETIYELPGQLYKINLPLTKAPQFPYKDTFRGPRIPRILQDATYLGIKLLIISIETPLCISTSATITRFRILARK